MDKSLPPSEAKLQSLREQGVVAKSPTAVRLAAGAAALMSLVVLGSSGDFNKFFAECSILDANCRIQIEELIGYTTRLAISTAALSIVAAIGATLAVSQFYFRVGRNPPHARSRIRALVRVFSCMTAGVAVSACIIGQFSTSLFGLFNVDPGSGYTLIYRGFLDYLRSASWIWIGTGIVSAFAIGSISRALYRGEHAMTKEEVLRESRG